MKISILIVDMSISPVILSHLYFDIDLSIFTVYIWGLPNIVNHRAVFTGK